MVRLAMLCLGGSKSPHSHRHIVASHMTAEAFTVLQTQQEKASLVSLQTLKPLLTTWEQCVCPWSRSPWVVVLRLPSLSDILNARQL
mmetsp:Transcript_52735/g.133914  ORF Transcript_52735/g.133914 Transcript_52735/m.133914 type:complete len:87 (-) Transcript_52735:816-1076(-)